MKKKRELFSAVVNGNLATVKRFIDTGTDMADPNMRDDYGHSPLHVACTQGHTDTARMFIDAGVDPNMRDEWGNTPLHLACRQGHADTAHLLIEAGADIDARKWGNTPLHFACSNGHTDLVRLLIQARVDVNVRNDDSRTPLDLVLNLKTDDPSREQLIDLFRQYAPDLVMEVWCTQGPGGM